MKNLNIGLVGYGFMGRTHSNAFSQVNHFFDVPYRPVLKAVCARNAARAEAFAKNWGYQEVVTDWRKLVEFPEIDLIDIASPNDTHAEIAIAAAQAGKMVMCEKPLGRNAAEAEAMVRAVESAGVPNSVWYNYRRVPAVTLAKQIIDEGRLGRIFHYRAKFLQDWTISTELPQGGEGLWRLDVSVAGSGVTGDLLAHCIDTAMWLNGGIEEVSAMTETFIKSRKHNLTGKVEPVGIDDASAFLARFRNGSLATFEATRYARGHKALYTFEINGEHASIAWDLHDLHRLQYFDHRDEGQTRGWRNIHISDSDHPYMKQWWVPGLQIGYEHTFIHQAADFLRAVDEGKSAAPNFREALLTDYVTDAVLQSASDRVGLPFRLEGRAMPKVNWILSIGALVLQGGLAQQIPPLRETGFESIFDGKTLKGWDGDPQFWRVEGGALVGETSTTKQPEQNTFLIWRGGSPADFELKLEYRLTGFNSGIQYRSSELPDIKWAMKGYQADIDGQQQYTGQIYEERGREFLALRGQFTYIGDGQKPALVGSLGSSDDLKKLIHGDDWNELHLIARGNTIEQLLNGRLMSMLIDDDKANRMLTGLIGIQVHRGAPMKIEVRNIRLKKL